MTANIPALNIISSPPSGGTRTHHGTPSTIPTIMSPDTGTQGYDNGTSIPKLELPSHSSLASRRNLSVTPVAIPTRLSPTAEDFTPTADTATFAAATARVGVHTNTRLTSRNPGIIGSGPAARPDTPTQDSFHHFGTFTTEDRVTRAFVVSGMHERNTSTLYEYIAVSYRNFKSIVNINAQNLSRGIFSVEFYDHNEAKQALCLTIDFIFYNEHVQCYKLTPREIARHNGLSPASVSNHVAEYIVSIVDVGNCTSTVTAKHVFEACQACGKVKAFHTIQPLSVAMMSFRVEWSDTRTNATQLSMATLLGYRITIIPYTPDVVQRKPAALSIARDQFFKSEQHARDIMAFLKPETPSRASCGANHNIVDVMKILLGQDVRTTIMLRNIPNRVDQANLKKLLDETSKGQYDFMYLRIDFANNCNVGYAFINFVDPMAIVPFARARAGQKWNLFQSDKVAEISYATIQGRDCLIQKFRNSSVMLERAEFTPKLYRTGDGSDAGIEEPFPAADNQAKLKRSCDNAEHVGLYIPDSPSGPGSSFSTQGTSTVPPPRNQRAGGHYTKPLQSRRAVILGKALTVLERDIDNDEVYLSRSSSSSPTSLYAPREGQAYRERQRRQFSLFDRGTPGAESELTTVSAQAEPIMPRRIAHIPDASTFFETLHRGLNGCVTDAGYGSRPHGNRYAHIPTSVIPFNYSTHVTRAFSGLGN